MYVMVHYCMCLSEKKSFMKKDQTFQERKNAFKEHFHILHLHTYVYICALEITIDLPLIYFDSSIANAAEFDLHDNFCKGAEISHFRYHLWDLD